MNPCSPGKSSSPTLEGELLRHAPPQLSPADGQFWLERVYTQVPGLPRLAPLAGETPLEWMTRAISYLSPALGEICLVLCGEEHGGEHGGLRLEAQPSREIRRLELGPWYARLEASNPALAAGALRELARVWPFGMWTPFESWAMLQDSYWGDVDENRELRREFPKGKPRSEAKQARYAKLLRDAAEGYTYAEAALELPSYLSARENFNPFDLPSRDTLLEWCDAPLFRPEDDALTDHLRFTLKALGALEDAQEALGVDTERMDAKYHWSGEWFYGYGTLAHVSSPPYGLHREMYDEFDNNNDFSEADPLLDRALEVWGELFTVLCQAHLVARLMTWLENHLNVASRPDRCCCAQEEVSMQPDHVTPALPTLLECQHDLEARVTEGNQISSEALLEWWRAQTGPSLRPSEALTLGAVQKLMTGAGIPLECSGLGLL